MSGTLGKNVTLEWNYTLTSTNVLDYFALLKFKGRPSTKIMKYDKSVIVFYDSFREKVVLLQRGTPSFMLLNLKMDDKAEYCCEVNTKPSANGMQGDSEINCTQLIILGRSILNQGIRLESFLSQNDLYCIKWRLLHQTFYF